MAKTELTKETTDIISVDNLKSAIAKNSFVDLDEALINSIHQLSDKVEQTQSINEQTAKEIIDKWHKKNLLGTKKFDATRLQLTVSNEQTIYLQSQYHCETREFKTYYEPYSNQTIPDKAEELWDKPAHNEFTVGEIKWKRIGNNEIKNCFSCSASGLVTCGDCRGSGKVWVQCPNCKGKGQIERTDAIIGRGGGKMAGGVVLRHEQCVRCQATGKLQVTCSKCNGRGELTCGTCHGKKKLFYYDQVEGKTSVISKDLILSTFPNLKDRWIKENKTPFPIQYKDEIQEEQKIKGRTAKDNSLTKQIPPNGKLLLEKYSVKVLPTAKITFSFNNKARELYISDNNVFANETGYLYDRKKTSIVIGIVATIIIVVSVLAYNWYSNYQATKYKEQNQTALNICKDTKQILSSGSVQDAGQKLSSLELANDYDQATKDSINSAVQEILTTALNNKSTNGVNSVCAKFSNAQITSDENKKLISDFNTILATADYLQIVELSRQVHSGTSYEKQKRFEQLADYDAKIDSILNLPVSNQNVLACIQTDSIAIKTSQDFEDYLSQLLSFEMTGEGMPCSIDSDLKLMETYFNKLKSPAYNKLNEKTNKNLSAALVKYKNACE